MRWFLLAMLLATVTSTDAFADDKRPTQVHFVVQRKADGKKYPNDVQESYTLDAKGVLTYSAYFGSMPTTMNHNDGITWKAGDLGKQLFEVIAKVRGELVLVPDDKPAPNGGMNVYLIRMTNKQGDSTYVASDPKGKAWAAIDPAHRAMIAAFEKATGRPKKPHELPQ